jgi:predicted GNAT family acetyltransferase
MSALSSSGGAPDLEVVRDDERSRYEGYLGGELTTVIDFDRQGDLLTVTHTGTEPRWRGRGLAAETTRLALEDVRTAGLRVVPVCPFTADYFDQHPEVADLRA